MAQYDFFATQNDLIAVLHEFEKKHALKYVLMFGNGSRERRFSEWPVYETASEIEDLSIIDPAFADDHRNFAVLYPTTEVKVKEIATVEGVRRHVNAMDYQEGFVLIPGGLRPDNVLISGAIVTTFWNNETKKFFNSMRRVFRKHFKIRRNNSYWVGDEAFELLQQGFRLTMRFGADPQLDIARDEISGD